VKVLSAGAGDDVLRRTLQRELEALARIRHPGVVSVLDTGTLEDGSPFLVMQYAEGITLRQALADGPLATARAAAVLRQIGAALEAVHAVGVAHRDVKPENIVFERLSDGSEVAKLIDFGIAQVERPGAATETTGSTVAGSVRYMAPEQFRGEHSRASDVYALGLVACEILCGHPDIRAVRTNRRARRLLRAALAWEPQDRPASARTFCDRLAASLHPARRWPSRTAAAAAVAAVLLLWATWSRVPAGAGGSGDQIQTLAILPFQMLGPPGDMDALQVGVADALITRLSSLSGLIVRPISTVRRYSAPDVDPVRVAKELAVDAVVEGTLQSSPTGVRASVRLIRAADGRALWTGTVESAGGPLFTLEDSIAQQIASSVNARLTDAERRALETRRRLDPESHELYIKGRFEWGKRTREGFEKAADYFRGAIDLDPTYARAYVGLADAYLLLGGYGHDPQLQTLPKARALASRALDLDPSLGEAHATLGLISQNLDWKWTEVEDHYQKAVALSPNYATAHHWYAEFLSILGRFDESRLEFARARRIDPISSIIEADEAQLYFFERQYDRSLEILKRLRGVDPGFDLAQERIALVHLARGRADDAWRAIQNVPGCRDASSDCYRVWTAYLPERDPAAARAALRWMEAEARTRPIPEFGLVYANARQGHAARALDWLEDMVATHAVQLITCKVNPLYDPLRAEPRFQRVLQTLDLAR
jgi:serine/threonine-protein kinase